MKLRLFSRVAEDCAKVVALHVITKCTVKEFQKNYCTDLLLCTCVVQMASLSILNGELNATINAFID